MGLMNARKLKNARKKFRDNRLPDKKKRLGISLKFDPIGRAAQAKGIVVKKIQKEAKQPNSAMRKHYQLQNKHPLTNPHPNQPDLSVQLKDSRTGENCQSKS